MRMCTMYACLRGTNSKTRRWNACSRVFARSLHPTCKTVLTPVQVSLDGLNIVRKALRHAEDGEVEEEEEEDPEKRQAALGPLGFMHPFFGSFRRRVQPGDWEVVAAALDLDLDPPPEGGAGAGGSSGGCGPEEAGVGVGGEAGGVGAGVGVGVGGTVRMGMVAAATAAVAPAAAGAAVVVPVARAQLEPAAAETGSSEEADADVEAAEVAAEVQLGRPAEERCAAAAATGHHQLIGEGCGKGGPTDGVRGSGNASSDGSSSAGGLGGRRNPDVPVSVMAAGSKAAAPAALPVAAMPSLPAPAPVTPTVSGFDEHASVLSALNGYSLAAAVVSKGAEGPGRAEAAATAAGAAAPARLSEEERRQ